MTETTLSTPLTERHREMGAKMTEFAGWHMPLQYSSVLEEHEAVRTAVGLFDLSHMAEFEVRGAGAANFLQEVLTNDISRLTEGQALYSCLCDLEGGIIDDLLVYRFQARFWIVANASNRVVVWSWLQEQAQGQEVELEDLTEQTALIAIQGPKAEDLLAPHVDDESALRALDFYRFRRGRIFGRGGLISRTGYTGEDGFELYLPYESAVEIWDGLLSTSAAIRPVGLAARDTLRLESGFALYGNELTRQRTPYHVSLGWVTKLDKQPAPRAAAALKRAQESASTCLVGLEMEGRAVPRSGYPILHQGRQIGEVTSGTFSPTLKKGVALGIVERSFREAGAKLEIAVRGKPCEARVVKLPFVRGSVKRHS